MQPVSQAQSALQQPHGIPRPLNNLCERNLSPLHLKLLFELSLENNPSIARYEPEFYSAGGEHIVYLLGRRSGLVAKLHVDDLIHGCTRATGQPAANREVRAPAERIALENSRLSRLSHYVGADALLRQRNVLQELHVSRLMLAAVTENRNIDRDLRLPVGVTLQQVAEILQHPERRVLTVGSAESTMIARDSYAAVTERYAYGEHASYQHALAMRMVQPSLWISGIMGLLGCDRQFAQTLRTFVSRVARYVNETGEGLDLFGSNNVVFAPTRSGWEYKVIDGLYPLPGLRERAYRACAALVRNETPEGGDAISLRNYLNLMRAVNFLAEHTAGQPIAPIPPELRVRTDRLLNSLSAYSVS